jgi:hypothetical protein
VVALFGGALGLLTAAWSLPVIATAIEASLPRMMGGWFLDLTPDLRVFAYTFGLSFVSGTMFGLAAAPISRARPHCPDHDEYP